MHSHWPKAILLDLDDTILAFDSVADPCWRTVCETATREVLPCHSEELFVAIKTNANWYWSDPLRQYAGRMNLLAARTAIVELALAALGHPELTLASAIAIQYGVLRDQAIAPLPGAIDTVRRLREEGVKLALLTNGAADSQRAKVDRFALAPLFDCVLIEGEVGIGKPDERIYRRALQELQVTADDTWMIGDNLEWEVLAPQQLGIKGIWVNAAGKPWPAEHEMKPHRIVRALADLFPAGGQAS